MKKNLCFLLILSLLIQLLFCSTVSFAQDQKIFDNGNIAAVQSQPTSPTTFTVISSTLITHISNYHYFNNNTMPGTISLKHSDGTVYGPWSATGAPGMGNVNNALWDVYPNSIIKGGTYTVIDSNPQTWSQNAASNGCGFSLIEGQASSTSSSGNGTPTSGAGVPTTGNSLPTAATATPASTTAPFPATNSQSNTISLQIDNPNMLVNGVNKEVDPGRGTKAILLNGRTVIPIRAVVEAMGGKIGWDGAASKITISAGSKVIEMWLENYTIRINGVDKSIDVAPTIINSRTVVPIRFVAENLNCTVDWISHSRTINISYIGKSPSTIIDVEGIEGIANIDGIEGIENIDDKVITLSPSSPYKPVSPAENNQIISFEKDIKLTIQGGTIGKTEQVFIHPMPKEGINSSLLQPLAVYDIKIGKETQFSKDLIISVPYDPTKLNPNYSPQSQFIAAFMNDNSNKWQYIPCEVDTTNNLINIRTNHLCGFQIGQISSTAMINNEFRDEYGSNAQIKQNFINKVNSAYNAAAGAIGSAYQTAKGAFVSVIDGSAIASVYDTIGYYYRDYISTGVGKAVNHGAMYLVGRYYIYFDADDLNDIDDNASVDYYTTNSDNTRPSDLVYGKNFFYINDGKVVDSISPIQDSKIKVPRYIKDVAAFLTESENVYKGSNITVPSEDLMVVVYNNTLMKGNPSYEKIAKVMYIPVKSPQLNSKNNLKLKIAHELFHNLQSSYIPVLTMANHTWLVESTAEYASLAIAMKIPVANERPLTTTLANGSIYRYFDFAATATGSDHEYTSANFIDYMLNTKKITLSAFLSNCKEKIGIFSNDADLIGTYLNSIDGTNFTDKFNRVYADFVAYTLLGNGSLLSSANAYTDYNIATNKILENKVGITQVANSVWDSSTSKPSLYGVKVEADPKTDGKQINISVKANSGQTIFVYTSNENQRLADITPILIVGSGGSINLPQKLTQNTIIYFLSLSNSSFANISTALAGEKDNCKISNIIPALKITQKSEKTFSYEVTGFEHQRGCKYDWNFGDFETASTDSNITSHFYNYEIKPGSAESIYGGKTFFVMVKVTGPDGKVLANLNGDANMQLSIQVIH